MATRSGIRYTATPSTEVYASQQYSPVNFGQMSAFTPRGGGTVAAAVAAHPAAQRAIERRVRLWAVKDADGHRTDRDYSERPIRSFQPTLAEPNPYTEPTSHADLFSWASSTPEAGGPPGVRPGARDISQLLSPVSPVSYDDWISDRYRRAQLVKSQGSSFLATRYGLCRIRQRRINSVGDETRIVTDIVPWGASINYPAGVWPQPNSATDVYPQAMTNIKATNESPWPHIGSGCMPLFFMDQPHPYMPARASVVRDVDRFGDTVRLKYRELKIVMEEFPYYNTIDPGTGLWSPQPATVADPSTRSFGLSPMPPRPADRVRVILFSRKKHREETKQQRNGLYVPIFPPKPSAGDVGSGHPTLWQADQTYDTPSHGELVFTYPSSALDSDCVIHEDVVMEYPKYRADDLPQHGLISTFASAGSLPDVVSSTTTPYAVQPFNSYGSDAPRYPGGPPGLASSGSGMMPALDADGLPHHRRRLVFYRKFNDDGHTLSWTVGSGEDQYEMTAARTTDYAAGQVQAASGELRAFGDSSVKIDMADRELFVTVVTGAYIESRKWQDPATSSVVIDAGATVVDTNALTNSIGNRAWRLSPANVCMPSLVSIKTKMWYADEPMTSIPRSITVVDAAGVPTGRLRVREVGSTIGGALTSDLLPLGDINPQIASLPQPPV